MLRTVLTLSPRQGAREAVLSVYRESGILELAVREAGCVATELQVTADPAGPLLVTALWASRAEYEAWATHPARAELAGRLLSLLADAHLDEYKVVARAVHG